MVLDQINNENLDLYESLIEIPVSTNMTILETSEDQIVLTTEENEKIPKDEMIDFKLGIDEYSNEGEKG